MELELRLGAGHRFAWSRASLALGLELGPLLVFQTLADDSSRTSLGLTTALSLEGRVKLFGPLEAFLHGAGGGAVVKKIRLAPAEADRIVFVPRLAATLGLALSF
jgi:hypothetical protein